MAAASRLRQGAEEVCARLRAAGHQAYFAGGCVRDLLLGGAPKDFDVVTDAHPEAIAGLFPRARLVGAAFGVVLVRLDRERSYEVATFRSDGSYTDGRRPDEVRFSDTPEEDVERRDFTINAMLMDPVSGAVLDWVGGQNDLAAGLIRAVGDARVRFQEDRLRLLRAVRFAARLGFRIEGATLSAMRAEAPGLGDVSAERVTDELWRIFGDAGAGQGIALLKESALLGVAVPFLGARAAHLDLAPLAAHLGGVPAPSRAAWVWAWLFLVGGAADCTPWAQRFKWSRQRLRAVQQLVSGARDVAAADMVRLRRVAASAHAKEVESLVQAWPECGTAPAADLRETIRSYADKPLPPRPLLVGADLKALGLTPGPDFKRWLEAVDDAVLARALTDRDAALAWLRSQLATAAS